jgi:pimeloyl-ACP methyl ester carboxylesterase
MEGPRAAGELGLLAGFQPLLRHAPIGDGHSVLVLPGLMADDRSTRILRQFLRVLGYHAHGWRLGRNVGPTEAIIDGLVDRMATVHASSDGRPVSIVGWSLGGIYARELARSTPDAVRQVITLGSPFGDAPGEESYPSAMMRRLYGPSRRPPLDRARLPVPSTAIFSRSDGIVPWRATVETRGPRAESIEVVASHCGLGHHPAVLWAIADRLAQPIDDWRAFQPTGPWSVLYPTRRVA